MEVVLHGPLGRSVLGPATLTIGRARDNQLVMNDPKVSSHHAEMRPSGQGYSITDLDSTNGTFVNDQRLARHTPRPLTTGDRIRIGDTVFAYEVTGATPVASGGYLTADQGGRPEDVPTIAVASPSEYTAYGQDAQLSYAPMPPSYTSPPQRQPYTPVPPAYQPYAQPSPQQPYTPPGVGGGAPNRAAPGAAGVVPIYGAAVQQPYVPTPPPRQQKSSAGLRVLLIALATLLILGVSGSVTAYLLTRPQPVIRVTSKYHVGSTLAGSTSTAFHVSGQKFSADSAITFLLDSTPVPGNTSARSDASGNVQADLTVTGAWIVGSHTLTARDASGYTTRIGVALVIVPQGQAHTFGPNGAPPDDMSFTITANIQGQIIGKGTPISFTDTLKITGSPDSSGGTVCQSYDNGQPQIVKGDFGGGITYTETLVLQCSGTYKGGKLSYTETVTSNQYTLSGGATCVGQVPFVIEHLEGAFSSGSSISGNYSGTSSTASCTDGHIVTVYAKTGTWSGLVQM